MNLDAKIPEVIRETAKTLENKGFEAFLIGGCVRDILIDREPKDWDLTTNATPEEIQAIFPETFYENNFGTVGVKTRSEIETLKVVEITPYRLEGKYSDKRHPDAVQFSKNLEDDIKRRDFTVNAIAYNILKGQIVDLYKGQYDLDNKVLRTVGDPGDRFEEDALRMLRAIRFSAELGFMINTETQNAIFEMKRFMNNVSRERIRDEFTKIIMSKNPMIGLMMTQKLGILEFIAPVLENMVGVNQNKQAHLYDVWEHSLRTLQHAADKELSLVLRLAALFHDIAKPQTKREVGGKTTFYGHDVVGARIARETLSNLNFSKEIIDKVTNFVRWHMFFSDTEEITPSAVRRLIRNVGKDNIWDLMELRKCDRIGSGRPKEEPYRLRKFEAMLDEVMSDPIDVTMLKINGNILINDLKMAAGPKIGYILHALLEEVLDNPDKNTEVFLVKRAGKLAELDIEALKALGETGKEAKKEAQEAEVKEIRGKRGVK
jgi:poly(A) polymerase/tRNA nucleotidyltransferase (CCA-adding enzyme)